MDTINVLYIVFIINKITFKKNNLFDQMPINKYCLICTLVITLLQN